MFNRTKMQWEMLKQNFDINFVSGTLEKVQLFSSFCIEADRKIVNKLKKRRKERYRRQINLHGIHKFHVMEIVNETSCLHQKTERHCTRV